MSIPSLTRSVDTEFVTTWYKIQKQLVDNITSATPVFAALKTKGCLTPQVGEEFITRSIQYDLIDASHTHKGGVLKHGEQEIETAAHWTWRWLYNHVQRSMMTDQKNRGTGKNRSLVGDMMMASRRGLSEKLETNLFRAYVSAETGDYPQSILDIIPLVANKATGTYGKIARSNSWWQGQYKSGNEPAKVNLVTDMNNLYNTISANQYPPDLIVSDQSKFEEYETMALDKSHVVKGRSTKLTDLGFEVLYYKGHEWVWSPNVTDYHVLMLYTPAIELVYDPGYWFDLTSWRNASSTSTDRVLYIFCAYNLICSELRRQGRLYYTA